MFGIMCQLMPTLTCWTWRLSCSPNWIGTLAPAKGSGCQVPLMVVVLLPKSMKSYSALIDQLFHTAHSMPVPTVHPTRSVLPVPENQGVDQLKGKPGGAPAIPNLKVWLSVSSRCAQATPAFP